MAVTYKVPQIQNGDKGIAVVLFQAIMKYRINGMSGKPFYEGEIDGEFGPMTEKAAIVRPVRCLFMGGFPLLVSDVGHAYFT